jgi:hypothetical protein
MTSLDELDLTGMNVTAAAVSALQRELPECTIIGP